MNIIFDLDDTLHDKQASLRNYGTSLWQKNRSYIESELGAFVDAFIDENTIIQPKVKVFENLGRQFNIAQPIRSRLLIEFDKNFHEFAIPFANTLDVLGFLKNRDVKIACVTNGRDFFQRNKISALGIAPYLDVIVTSDDFGVKKPAHSIFIEALRLLESSAELTCMCGDSLQADIKPSKELGFTTIWKSREQSQFADYSFNEFTHFYEIWERISAEFNGKN